MSATGLDVFDKTVQTTNIWLNEIMDEMGPDRRHAWHMLGAVLHALRDRLHPDLAVKLGAQLPILACGAPITTATSLRRLRISSGRSTNFWSASMGNWREPARSTPRTRFAWFAMSFPAMSTTDRRKRSGRRCRKTSGRSPRRFSRRRATATGRTATMPALAMLLRPGACRGTHASLPVARITYGEDREGGNLRRGAFRGRNGRYSGDGEPRKASRPH